MLEGKAKITLTDVRTGKEEVHEQHNLVTNAIKDAYSSFICANKVPNSEILPLYSKGLGGLILFDKELTENVDNVNLPGDAHIIGVCDRTTNTSISYMGSLTSESGEIQNGFKNVWEFSTSQCNGTIKSLSLTNYKFLNISSYTALSNFDYGKIVSYSNGFFYSIKKVDNTNWTVYKIDAYIDGFKVGSNAGSFNTSVFKTLTVPNLGIDPLHSSIGDDGYVYTAKGINSTRLGYFTIKISDLSFDVSSLYTLNISNVSMLSNVATYCNGYFYIVNSGSTTLLKIDKNMEEPVVNIVLSNYLFNRSSKAVLEKNNGLITCFVYAGGNSAVKRIAYIYTDNSIKIFENHTHDMTTAIYGRNIAKLIDGNRNLFYTQGSGNMDFGQMFIRDYVGTICNLETPIIKDNTKTMKIEYSIIDS